MIIACARAQRIACAAGGHSWLRLRSETRCVLAGRAGWRTRRVGLEGLRGQARCRGHAIVRGVSGRIDGLVVRRCARFAAHAGAGAPTQYDARVAGLGWGRLGALDVRADLAIGWCGAIGERLHGCGVRQTVGLPTRCLSQQRCLSRGQDQAQAQALTEESSSL